MSPPCQCVVPFATRSLISMFPNSFTSASPRSAPWSCQQSLGEWSSSAPAQSAACRDGPGRPVRSGRRFQCL